LASFIRESTKPEMGCDSFSMEDLLGKTLTDPRTPSTLDDEYVLTGFVTTVNASKSFLVRRKMLTVLTIKRGRERSPAIDMSMRVTVGELRGIIREEVSRKTGVKAFQLVRQAVDAANDYLRAVKHRSDDPGKYAKSIDDAAKQLSVLAQWMIKHREPEGDTIGRVAKVATDLAKITSFWQRPTFVGREGYTEQVEELVERLKKFAVEARKAASARVA
jgi:hypothetical protein